MLRALIAYILCIVVATAALGRALQPVAAPAIEVPAAKPVYPRTLVTVWVSVEDAPSEARTCNVEIDRVSADTFQVATLVERDRILEALGCEN